LTEYKYVTIDGFKCYNPAAVKNNSYYPPEAYEELFKLENNNFWFKSRNRFISFLFKKYLKNNIILETLEIGCGTGFVLSELQKNKNLNLTGAEVFIEGLSYAAKRLPDVNFIQLDAVEMPFEDELDVICTFDVLEHIEQDTTVIKNIYKALKPGGYFFISVPQHQWLWSVTDDFSNHKRRYSKKELINKLKDSGFRILYTSSFVFLLFPIMLLSRMIMGKKLPENKENELDLFREFKIPPVVNHFFSLVLSLEHLMIKLGIRLPFGGSLIAVAYKY
jgi:SAM-dependent methyltransferase